MLAVDMLRQVLYQQAVNAVAANGSFPCQIGEEAFTPPDDGSLYGEFWFRLGKAVQMEVGPRTGWKCQPGILQFTLYAPERNGEGAVLRLADALAQWFDQKKWQVPPDGNVTIEPTSVQPLPGRKDGNKVVIVDAGLDFYFRNPNAT